MKICFLSDANSAHTKKWCKYLTEKGCDIHVISLNPGDIEGVTVHHFDVDREMMNSGNSMDKFSYIFKARKIKSMVEEIKPDLLHAHYATSYGLLGAFTGYHPYVISVWGSDIYDFPKKSFIHKALVKHNLKKADRVLSTSHAMAEETALYTDKPITITPFGVDTNMFKKLSHCKNSKEFTIGIVKSLEKNYGIDYLIKAFNIVKTNNPEKNLKLEIAGQGSEKDNLEQLVDNLGLREQVKFLGFLKGEDIVRTYNRFDIAVFPSIIESFGVSAVEAQACGVPVIVSEAEGLLESTKPGFSSLVVKRQDEKSLAEAIQKLMDDEKLRNTMGTNGMEYVKENFRIEDNFEAIIKIYEYMLKKN